MTVLQGASIDRFLSRPDRSLVLIYGPDRGLVQERSAAIIATFLGPDADAMSRTVLEGDRLADAPQRLVEEAYSVPMFGGRTAIRVTPTSESLLRAIEPLLRQPPRDCLIVIEAGDLKRSAPLRRLVEQAETAVALPCYPDDDNALDRLIAEELTAHGIDVSRDAREALHHLLGGDRLASRGELRKLASYALGQPEVSLEDVEAVIGDASALAVDSLLDSACTGDAAAAQTAFSRLVASGTGAGSILGALSRHLLQIAEARTRVEAGATADAAMRAMRPPPFFKRKEAMRRQLALWRRDMLEQMLETLLTAEGETRRHGDLAEAIAGRALLLVTHTARREIGR
ncbi:DNA polymerase III delta subunit [Tepidamorphus gemmatus]|uniref:DNA polymerase III subunit delta n=1 Tax=Tepidamorphus gemmatus TaxID=747076 RepID=A0A4R3MHP0_9HYPH|nr:DNA polymerase III subunit delta [Tepidamorphus gemmatus]TCT11889.1 DNA polymerase III delta subunit [Tepidamorphus gemmatus]